jgi:signal peptidase I
VAIETDTDSGGDAAVTGSEAAPAPDAVGGASAEPPAADAAVDEPVRRRPKPFPRAEASTSNDSTASSVAVITAGGPLAVSDHIVDATDGHGFLEQSTRVITLTKPLTTDKDGRRVESGDVDLATSPQAQKTRTTKKPRTGSSGSGGPWRLIIMVVLAVIAAFALRAYVVAPYYIPSSSMEKTLHGCSGCNNDHVLVDKLSYHLHSVHRGDIVVFNRPASWASVHDKVLIKRVIGLPGDVLSVSGGKLFVNGQLLDEPYLDKNCPPMTSLAALGAPTLLQADKVPAGDLFVMGDNRCQSDDSRTNGPIPRKSVIGRAFVIIWPLGRIHYL